MTTQKQINDALARLDSPNPVVRVKAWVTLARVGAQLVDEMMTHCEESGFYKKHNTSAELLVWMRNLNEQIQEVGVFDALPTRLPGRPDRGLRNAFIAEYFNSLISRGSTRRAAITDVIDRVESTYGVRLARRTISNILRAQKTT